MKASFSQSQEVFYRSHITLIINQYWTGRVYDFFVYFMMGARGGSIESGSEAIIGDCLKRLSL